jgi:hypothetical protein
MKREVWLLSGRCSHFFAAATIPSGMPARSAVLSVRRLPASRGSMHLETSQIVVAGSYGSHVHAFENDDASLQ